MTTRPIVRWASAATARADRVWEEAYRRFETPEEEVRKFLSRLRRAGAPSWPRSARVAELFCGRGNGLVALERLGFTALVGVDLSEELLRDYQGPARLYCGDCRALELEPGSLDAVVVQGGLHHLPGLPGDLEAVLDGACRALVPGGRLVLVEPWASPFLGAALLGCELDLARRAWPRLDAYAVMVEREGETFARWLAMPRTILALLDRRFEPERREVRRGALLYVGRKRAA